MRRVLLCRYGNVANTKIIDFEIIQYINEII